MDVNPWEEGPSVKAWNMACVRATGKSRCDSMETWPNCTTPSGRYREQNNSHRDLMARRDYHGRGNKGAKAEMN